MTGDQTVKSTFAQIWQSQQTQNICITFIQRRPNVFDVGPTLYQCFTNVLCLLASHIAILFLFLQVSCHCLQADGSAQKTSDEVTRAPLATVQFGGSLRRGETYDEFLFRLLISLILVHSAKF